MSPEPGVSSQCALLSVHFKKRKKKILRICGMYEAKTAKSATSRHSGL